MQAKRHGVPHSFLVVLILIIGVGFFCSGTSVYGSEEKEKKVLPPRGISIVPEYSSIMISEGEDVSIDLKVINRGQKDENIVLSLPSVPQGWETWINTYSFGVGS